MEKRLTIPDQNLALLRGTNHAHVHRIPTRIEWEEIIITRVNTIPNRGPISQRNILLLRPRLNQDWLINPALDENTLTLRILNQQILTRRGNHTRPIRRRITLNLEFVFTLDD